MPSDFPGAFAALRAILLKHCTDMIVQTDTPTRLMVATRATTPNKQPLFFGAVMLIKSAVTYHLYPIYFNPVLQGSIPAALLARKQGKTCFNFQRPDPELFAQLDQLTAQARAHWERHGFLESGLLSQEKIEAALRAGGEDVAALARLRKSKGQAAARKRAATLKRKATAKPARRTAAR